MQEEQRATLEEQRRIKQDMLRRIEGTASTFTGECHVVMMHRLIGTGTGS